MPRMFGEVEAEPFCLRLEANRCVEAMRTVVRVALVGQQLDLVAPARPRIDEDLLHHRLGDPAAPIPG